MAPHRTFRAGPPPERDQYPTFELAGLSLDGKEWSETFTTYPVAPAGVLEDLTVTIRVDPQTGRRRYNTPSCMAFMRAVVVAEDLDRFEALLHDVQRPVDLVELVGVTSWLSDVITVRPTRPSSASGTGGGPPEATAVTDGLAATPAAGSL